MLLNILHAIKLRRLYAFPFVFICLFLIAVFRYVNKFFPQTTLEQILFFINTPCDGADSKLVFLFVKRCLAAPFVYSMLICYAPEIKKGIDKVLTKIHFSYTFFVSVLFMLILAVYMATHINRDMMEKFFSNEYTKFYEKHYVEPKNTKINFPVKKNLIILHIESMEETFKNAEFFGQSLIPDIEKSERGFVKFNNYHDGYSTNFTQGSQIAIFTGMPPRYNSIINNIGNDVILFKDYYALGNILKDNGYSTLAIQGTDATFAGQKPFLQNHGIDEIIDASVIAEKYPQYESDGTWGYSDADVFKILREKITESTQKQPYFMYVLTVDTHFKYVPAELKYHKFDNPYYDTLYNTNKVIAEFIEWFKNSENYKNTTVVIVGDHLRMGDDFDMPQERSIYNLFINAKEPKNTRRSLTQIDLFPSIVEAMGGKIKGHRLGLGTSVFSKKKTLAERYSAEKLEEEMSKRNRLYESLFRK